MINVEVSTLAPQNFVEEIRLTSIAMANQDVRVAAEESGVIRDIYVDRGGRVAQGGYPPQAPSAPDVPN